MPTMATTIITIMTGGITHGQGADPGEIFPGIVTQKKSGIKISDTIVTGDTDEAGETTGTRGINGICRQLKRQPIFSSRRISRAISLKSRSGLKVKNFVPTATNQWFVGTGKAC
ncbi:hypothetical protein DAMNIGENAA_11610 [Desulforhabdus amnigena]|uniref:Uncharacterized protein n=1 Tax=Desulforhabdus amnigena TaxID=40218 RepID=A0A9W6D355_9BACT|nr:hypothetical protein DAMNIGENAA_11610 [Desulforhabdus amnigena]